LVRIFLNASSPIKVSGLEITTEVNPLQIPNTKEPMN